jgi:hypothetical protein
MELTITGRSSGLSLIPLNNYTSCGEFFTTLYLSKPTFWLKVSLVTLYALLATKTRKILTIFS